MKSKIVLTILILMSWVLVNCKAEIPKKLELKPKNKAELIGKSQSQVLAKKGKPVTTEEFKLGEGMNEFRVELQNFYPLTDEKNKKIKIRELTWNKGDEKLTVWFHNVNGTWRALEKYKWSSEREF